MQGASVPFPPWSNGIVVALVLEVFNNITDSIFPVGLLALSCDLDLGQLSHKYNTEECVAGCGKSLPYPMAFPPGQLLCHILSGTTENSWCTQDNSQLLADNSTLNTPTQPLSGNWDGGFTNFLVLYD
jgi:hypothetical protein